MQPRPRLVDRQREIAAADVLVERGAGDADPGERRIDRIIDLRQLQRVEQRQLEMQPRLDPAGDLRGIDADVAGVTERLRVDDFEDVTQLPGHRKIDGEPFDLLPEFAQKQRAAGHLQPAQPAPGRRELEPVAIENRAPADLADRLQALQITDGQVMIPQRSGGLRHIGRARRRVESDGKLNRGFVEHAVMDVRKHPAPPAGAEGSGPQIPQPRRRDVPQSGRKVCRHPPQAAAPRGGGGDQIGGNLGDGAGDLQFAAAAEIEKQPVEAQLPAFRVVGGVQLPALDRDAAVGEQLAAQPAVADREIDLRGLGRVAGEIDPRAQFAGNRRLDLPQRRQFGNQRRDLGGKRAGERQVEIEAPCRGRIAERGAQLGHAGAERHRQREIAADLVGAALDRDIDRLDAPGQPAPAVVDQNRRAADRDMMRQRRRIARIRRQQAVERDRRRAAGASLAGETRWGQPRRARDRSPPRRPASRRRRNTGRSTVSEVGATRPSSSGPSATPIEVCGNCASGEPSGAATRTLSARKPSSCDAGSIPSRIPDSLTPIPIPARSSAAST